MKKIFALFLFVVSFLTIQAQTPYDTVNVRDPQNFVEMTSVDTAYFQLIGRKANLNRRMSLTTLKNWILSGVSGIDSVYYIGDQLNILQGSTLWQATTGRVADSLVLSNDSLFLYENGTSIFVDLAGGGGAADGNGLIDALPAGNVTIDGDGNNLLIDSAGVITLRSMLADTSYSSLGVAPLAGTLTYYDDTDTSYAYAQVNASIAFIGFSENTAVPGAGVWAKKDTVGIGVVTNQVAAIEITNVGVNAVVKMYGDTLDVSEVATLVGFPGGSQTLSTSNDTLTISGGNSVKLPGLDSVFVRNDSIYLSESGTEFFALKDPTGRNTSAPTSFGGDGVNIHFQPRVQLGLNNTWREEFPGIAYNPYTGRLVAIYRYADNHAYSANGRGVAQYSDDFGKTWSDTVHFAVDRTAGEDKGVDPGIFYDHNTRLFLANATKREDANLTDELVIIYSSSDGVAWATYDTIPRPAGTKAFRVANALQRLKDNRLVATGYTSDGAGVDSLKLWFLYSSDDGATWASTKVAQANNATDNGPNEGQIIQKPDGTIHIYARHNTDGKMYRYDSADNGLTWSAAVDVTPPDWQTNGTKPAFVVFSNSVAVFAYRRQASDNGSSIYAVTKDWGNSWDYSAALPQANAGYRNAYSSFLKVDDNIAIMLYAEGLESPSTGSDSPNMYALWMSSGASATGEQVQADVVQFREYTPGTLLEGATYYDGTSLRFQDASEAKTVAHATYEAKTATGSTSLALGSTVFSYKKVDCNLAVSFDLSVSGGIAGGQYKFHFQNADSTVINTPNSIRNLAGTVIGSAVVDSAGLFDCVHDGSVFHCVFEDATPQYSAVSFATIAEAADYIGSPYLEINAALETEYADEAATDTLHDFSGNNRHFVASGAARPTYDSLSTASGLPAFKFDGGDYAINATDADWVVLHSDSLTMFVVFKPGNIADPNAAYGIFGSNATSLNNTGISYFYDDRAAKSVNNMGKLLIGKGFADSLIVSSYSDDGTLPANTYNGVLFIANLELSAADSLDRMKISINDGAYIQNNQSSFPASRFMADIASTANATYDFQIGAAGNNSVPMIGEISVFLVWDRILSPAEIAILQTAYENEYGP